MKIINANVIALNIKNTLYVSTDDTVNIQMSNIDSQADKFPPYKLKIVIFENQDDVDSYSKTTTMN
mgnify:FL=1